MLEKYGYGYDYKSGLWVIGKPTLFGTIKPSSIVESFTSAEKAEQALNKYNN